VDLGLNGLRAVVSGGTGGIGREIGRQLLAEGASVAFCARDRQAIERTEQEFTAEGGTAFGTVVDVADADALEAWISSSADALGGIDIVVHNASALSGSGRESWKRSYEVDLLGMVVSVEAALPLLEQSEHASVVAIASTAAVEMFREPNSYGAIKAAIVNYASALSQSLGPKGIRCNVVSPGPNLFEGGSWAKVRDKSPTYFEETKAQVALGRLGTPEDVARAVAYLASPAACYVTGVNLVVDGGFTKRVGF